MQAGQAVKKTFDSIQKAAAAGLLRSGKNISRPDSCSCGFSVSLYPLLCSQVYGRLNVILITAISSFPLSSLIAESP